MKLSEALLTVKLSKYNIFLWGENSKGQIGNLTTDKVYFPEIIGLYWKSVALGKDYTLALRSDGKLFSWGDNTYGQLGVTSTGSSVPVQIGNNTWYSIYTKNESSFAIRSDGLLFAWGNNDKGQLGLNQLLFDDGSKWKHVAMGYDSFYAIRENGVLFGSGTGYDWTQTHGIGIEFDIAPKSNAVQIGKNQTWNKVASGRGNTAFLRSDGTLWGIGLDSYQYISIYKMMFHGSVDRNPDDGIGILVGGGGNDSIIKLSRIYHNSLAPLSLTFKDIFVGNNGGFALTSDDYLYRWAHIDAAGGASLETEFALRKVGNKKWSKGHFGIEGAEGYPGNSLPYSPHWFAAIRSDGLLYMAPPADRVNDQYGQGLNNTYWRVIDEVVSINNIPNLDYLVGFSWNAISSSGNHVLAKRSDGSLWSWGNNDSGQLGDGTTITRSSPVQLSANNVFFDKIFTTEKSSYGFERTSQRIYCWGNNDSGQLGDETIINRSTPTLLQHNERFIKSTGGGEHFLHLREDGKLFCAGNHLYGAFSNWWTQFGGGIDFQLHRVNGEIKTWADISSNGSWNLSDSARPYNLGITTDGKLWRWGFSPFGGDEGNPNISQVGSGTSWTKCSVGLGFGAAIDSNNQLYAWGNNGAGQLGNGATTAISFNSFIAIGTGSWNQVSCGYSHMAAIKTDGTLWSWGLNASGQVGDGTAANKSTPVQISGSWIQVSCGDFYTIAISSNNNTLFSWGGTPTQVKYSDSGLLTNYYSWSQISSGGLHTAAIRSDGFLFTWGYNLYGELGDGTSGAAAYRSSPVQIGFESWSKVSAGYFHTAAINSSNKLFTWGYNLYGQLGDGTVVARSSPVQIGSQSWIQISGGHHHTVAINSSNTIFTWGQNDQGQLGNGTAGALGHRSSPVQIGSQSWIQVSAGLSCTAAINSSNTLFTWGWNLYGQLGDGTVVHRSSPVQIGSQSWIQVSAGHYHTAAINSSNLLFTWGYNLNGELGNGTAGSLTYRSSPVQIGSQSWIQVFAGDNHTAAINSSNNLFTWGYNGQGQLGDGTIVNRSSPVQIGTQSWIQVSAGVVSTTAINSSNALFTWGYNLYGQLGDGTIVNKSSPVNIIILKPIYHPLSNLIQVSAGTGHAAAINSSNTLFTWGNNNAGQLGDGTTVNKSIPRQIGNDSWTFVYAGFSRTSAINYKKELFNWGWKGNSDFPVLDNTNTSRSSPLIVGNKRYIDLDTKENFVLGLTGYRIYNPSTIWTSNTVYSWGNNNYGQLGDGTVVARSSPVFLANATNISDSGISEVFAGTYHSGYLNNKQLWLWGSNLYGELGDGTDLNYKTSPIVIPESWSQISSGRNHTAAIRSDGILFTWGSNGNGQLGVGTVVHRSSPVQIGFDSWIQVSAIGDMTAAINSSNKLFTWGNNLYGQLGDGTVVAKSSPVQIGSQSWIQVSAGASHTAAINSSNKLFTWGFNLFGQLGDGTIVDKLSPVQIGSQSWIQVSAGDNHTAAINSSNKLFTWGFNFYGELGNGTGGNGVNRSSPVQIGSQSWIQVSAGGSHTAAINSSNTIFSWGGNSSGQLGDGTVVAKSSPVQIGSQSWIQVSAGSSHTAAINSSNTLFTWGSNNNGQLGDGTAVAKSSPVQIGSESWSKISAGASHIAAINSSNKLFTWGYNILGQLGDGTAVHRSSPVQVGNTFKWNKISFGTNYSMGITNSGYMSCWGLNDYGQLGDGTTINKSKPIFIDTGFNTFTQISAGTNHTAAINSSNSLYTWGNNDYGKLLDGTTQHRSIPTLVDSQNAFISIITSRENTILHIIDDKKVKVYGKNDVGQIGDNSTNNYVSIYYDDFFHDDNHSWKQISGGRGFKCAIRQDNTLWAWGSNNNGQLGDGTTISRSSPVQIGNGTDWYLLSENGQGRGHFAAIKTDGTLWAWGLNTYGQLGDGTTISKSSPVLINSSSWKMVSTGYDTTAAIRNDDLLFVWGKGSTGQLANDSIIKHRSSVTQIALPHVFSPTQVGTNSWIQIAAGFKHTLGIRYDKTLWAWGDNKYSTLGDGTTIDKSSPVQIGSDSWIDISASDRKSMGINVSNELYVWGNYL